MTMVEGWADRRGVGIFRADRGGDFPVGKSLTSSGNMSAIDAESSEGVRAAEKAPPR